MYMYETKEQIDKLRNQLIEIVNEAKDEYSHDCTDRSETEYIVEGLLDMGVILPPCKIGDTWRKTMPEHVCTNCRNNRTCNHNEYGFENCDNWTPHCGVKMKGCD